MIKGTILEIFEEIPIRILVEIPREIHERIPGKKIGEMFLDESHEKNSSINYRRILIKKKSWRISTEIPDKFPK